MYKSKPLKLYVVDMLRWGDEENHSYIEGIYTTRREAKKHAKAEEEQRGGKYEAKIWVHRLNEPRQMKYMTEKEWDNHSKKAHNRIKRKHPDWFDEDGKLKV